MTLLDWLIVFALNGAIIAYGFYLARRTKTSSEWFLGERALPWWAVGMSMFATNVDNADLVGVTGNTYDQGLHIISVYAIGSAAGGVLAAFFIVPTIYRLGFYTNAEYLEARFGPAVRAASALIQVQYRTSLLGVMTYSLFLLLTRVGQVTPPVAWGMIVTLVVLAGLFTALGGLKSVVWTDVCLGLLTMLAGVIVFVAVWRAVGGWSGMTAALEAAGSEGGRRLADLPHLGRYRGESGTISPYLVVLGWTLIGSGYWTVNHTPTMRMIGSRSLWDMQMAAILGVGASMPIMISCACLGLFARALDLPEFESIKTADEIYPILANKYLAPGIKGLVLAGVAAAALATFDSLGSALAAVFTRDIYARFLVRDRGDAHYVRVSRIATIGVLALGFAYLPFIITREGGDGRQAPMIRAFTTLIPVFVTPLFTIYVVGALTRAHRQSGLIGLAAGAAYGVIALLDREFPSLYDFAWLPPSLSNRWAALAISFGLTAAAMILVTMLLGRQPEDKLLALYYETGWLERSREKLPPLREHPFDRPPPLWLRPAWWAAALTAISAWVVFSLFW